MKRNLLIIPLIIGACSLSSIGGTYSGGTGEPDNPYQLATKADLLSMAADANDYSKCFILTADIDLDPNLLGGQVFTTAIIAPDTNSSAGFQGAAFTGRFDGNGHKISNITINGVSNSYLGLFGYSDGSSIKNVGVENCSLSGNSNSEFAGGLVGHNNGNINNCYSTGSIRCHSYAGGLVGANVGELNITNCHSTAKVDGYIGIGGLVGDNSDGDITNCYSTGSVTGSSFVGGFVGDNWGNISSCYSTGTVSGFSESQNIGGFVGSNSESISNCYSTGSVSGFVVGGLVGWNSWSIANSYSTGMVTGFSGSGYAGGLVGVNDDSYGGSVVKSFWDTHTSYKSNGVGCGSSMGVVGETTAEMKMLSTFIGAGWDFSTPVWTIDEGVDYPHLWWENTAPVAEAGSDSMVYARIDGKAEVTLDGSGSNDADGDKLSYKWTWVIGADTYEANGVNPTIELPVGMYKIQLVVNDGVADSLPDDVNVTVVAPVEGTLKITPHTINRKSNQPYIQAVIQLPNGIAKNDIDDSEPVRLWVCGNDTAEDGCATLTAVRQQISSGKIFAFFDKDAVMGGVVADGDVELKVGGKLKSGQYFYGADTVKILH